MENDGKVWSNIDDNFLTDNYAIKGSKYCAEALKRKPKAIIAKARKLGLKSGRNSFKYSKEYIEPIVKLSKSIREVLDKMNLRAAGGNYKVINNYILKHEINTSHFEKSSDRISRIRKEKISLDKILIENSAYSRKELKQRLYKEGLKKRECELCGQGEEWKGKKMSLILDHKNGIHNDNRLKNLQIVCPNCNATLDTHAGKNNLKK